MAKKVRETDLSKSLEKLEEMAKGQLFHTSTDSSPGEWAGSDYDRQENYEDGIEDNGLDYTGVRGHLGDKVAKGYDLSNAEMAIVKGLDPVPYIVNKLEKGLDLTPAEQWVVKSIEDMQEKDEDEDDEDEDDEKEEKKAKFFGKSSEAPGHAEAPGTLHNRKSKLGTLSAVEEDGDDEAEVTKGLSSAIDKSYVMKSGIEMSPFLYEFVNAIDTALRGSEARINKSLEGLVGALEARDGEYGEFFKSLAESVVGIGELAKSQAEGAEYSASQPARGPKSLQTGLNKSIGGLAAQPDQLQKSQILDVMVELAKSQKISPTDVIAYEAAGTMHPAVQSAVNDFINGKR